MTKQNDLVVQDNFLSNDLFSLLTQITSQHDFFWSWNSILNVGFLPNEKYNRQLVHWFYPQKEISKIMARHRAAGNVFLVRATIHQNAEG